MDTEKALEIIEQFKEVYEHFYHNQLLKENVIPYHHHVIRNYDDNIKILEETQAQIRLCFQEKYKK